MAEQLFQASCLIHGNQLKNLHLVYNVVWLTTKIRRPDLKQQQLNDMLVVVDGDEVSCQRFGIGMYFVKDMTGVNGQYALKKFALTVQKLCTFDLNALNEDKIHQWLGLAQIHATFSCKFVILSKTQQLMVFNTSYRATVYQRCTGDARSNALTKRYYCLQEPYRRNADGSWTGNPCLSRKVANLMKGLKKIAGVKLHSGVCSLYYAD
ncbi:hypothetical protein MIR68_006249 [Amoeboaphelidium protococcarum]|nr:hypothetical protein MIR68_006249 [Amoeboaphelidium protococcarum]